MIEFVLAGGVTDYWWYCANYRDLKDNKIVIALNKQKKPGVIKP
jgi:hypothetical protein